MKYQNCQEWRVDPLGYNPLGYRRTSVAAFDKLLIEGAISVDHVSRMVGKTDGERGPSFKVDEDRRGELFIGRPREFVF
jgi:hypothetical protein